MAEKLSTLEKQDLFNLAAFFDDMSVDTVQIPVELEPPFHYVQFTWRHLTPERIMSRPATLTAYKKVYGINLFYEHGGFYAQLVPSE